MLNNLINVDLHIHSIASLYKEDKKVVDNSDLAHCDVLIDKLIDQTNDIRMFSITDHNRFDTDIYNKFYERIEARNLNLSLLPGVEFDVLFEVDKPAVHVVTLFDARNDDERRLIASALSEDFLSEPGESYSLTRYGQILCKVNLPTILIAHQHTGINAPHQSPRSMTAGTDNAISFYKFGYIDALEFTTPKVEAILKSELKELPLPASMLTGSDCHSWEAYPKHDNDPKTPIPSTYCMKIRALPTFKGLLLALTAPATRIGSQNYSIWEGCLPAINICGKEIPLSPGINAIIGENGVGKSSLLALMTKPNPRESHIKKTRKMFEVEIPATIDQEHRIVVEQGKIQADYQSKKVFDENLFLEVSHDLFENAVKNYSEQLKGKVKNNIERALRRRENAQTSFCVDPDKEGGSTHYVRVKVDEGFAAVPNPYQRSKETLFAISQKISDELTKNAIYESDEKTKLTEAKKLIDDVEKRVFARSLDKQAESKAKSYIQDLFEEYEEKITQTSSTFDNELAVYRDLRASFIAAVENLARDEARAPDEPVKPIATSRDWGISRNVTGGFNFVMASNYAQIQDVTTELLKSIFNAGYQTQAAIESIADEATIISALTGMKSGKWDVVWDENVAKFITKEEECKPSILDLENNGIGDTLGEEALTFYKYKTSELWRGSTRKVFIIDQPEDNISNARLASTLVDYLNRLRGKAQIIMVTHNPLLVVNQDVDNVIVLRKANGVASVSAGCLEYENEEHETILDYVANIMDGGREAIRRRLKAYGQDNHSSRFNG